MKKTKIICSIGPVSRNYETMKKMIENGMNVARINFSHATLQERKEAEEVVERLNNDLNANIAIMYDTKGPDFRTGTVVDEGVQLIEGKTIKIVKEDVVGNSERFTVNYKDALDNIEIGNTILLEDGLMKLVVVEKDNEGLTCRVINGGLLKNRKGINVPGVNLNVPFISDVDKEDIKYACNKKGDFIACSFVSSKEDIMQVRSLLKEYGHERMQIISKVESAKAIANLEDIVDYSDGVMVARGDLGVEVPLHEVPILQKKIVEMCRKKGKFCIVATEMLASMYISSRPTRAEVSDIANAVFDGADAVMLSGETTVGKHPDLAVKYMADICENTEKNIKYRNISIPAGESDITSAVAISVVESTHALGGKVIAAPTMSGYTARQISNYRPECPILAGCVNTTICKSLALNYGVYTCIVPELTTIEELIDQSSSKAKEIFDLVDGDIIVVTGCFPKYESSGTNFMKITTIK